MTTTIDGLDTKQVESLRAAMLARARQLRDEIRQTLLKSDSEHYVQIADEVRDLEDESFADLMVDVSLAEIDRDLEELRAIDAALLRIGDGSYGLCEVCDRPIEPKRLEVAPQVPRCIDCQTLYERTHFQKTGHTL
ncbi:MAG TPA: TraR/DksA family transcriptional regulator [Steroidobacteraceae bacterium]|jgi:RNA polymerase-binding protein DksA|nr:TraR/DksA family transcriptional regulator [Steroidobacteraceae bacterium]